MKIRLWEWANTYGASNKVHRDELGRVVARTISDGWGGYIAVVWGPACILEVRHAFDIRMTLEQAQAQANEILENVGK